MIKPQNTTRLSLLAYSFLVCIHGLNSIDLAVAQSADAARVTPVRSFQPSKNVTGQSLSPQENAYRMNEEGVKLVLRGKKEEGLLRVRRATELDPTNTTALYNLAGLYLSEGQVEDAIATMEKAISLDPKDLSFLNRMAEAHIANKNNAMAVKTYEQIVKVDPTYHQALLRLGMLYALEKRYGESEAALRKSLELNKNDASVLGNLGNVLVMQKKLDEAISVLNRAQSVNETPEIEISLGLAHEELKQFELALVHFKKARTLGTTDPNIDKHIEDIEQQLAR